MMSALSLIIPSKGRLKSQTEDWLNAAGLSFHPGAQRRYVAALDGIDGMDVQFFSAREISQGLVDGHVHLGITGEDVLREDAGGDLQNIAHLLMPLGFGQARLVTAVPQAWSDVESMADLAEIADELQKRTGMALRVATKYARLTYAFFERYHIGSWRMIASAGATEGAPAAGLADIIVDITTTGQTLADNNLKILSDGEILNSQAYLIASLRAHWNPAALQALQTLLNTVSEQSRFEAFNAVLDRKNLNSKRE